MVVVHVELANKVNASFPMIQEVKL